MTIESIAVLTHEVNKKWCQLNGDFSQESWSFAPDWQKESAVYGVQFHLDNPDADASASHDNWLDEKLADGWIYGDEKDPERKLHPCILPFEDLPEHQQIKDHLFKSVVETCRPFIEDF